MLLKGAVSYITLANQKWHREYSEPIKTQCNYVNLMCKAWQNDVKHVMIGFGFTANWMNKWRNWLIILKFFVLSSSTKPITFRPSNKNHSYTQIVDCF